MSSVQVKLATELLFGPQQTPVPVAAIIDRAADGTSVRFGLDRGPSDPPVVLHLGDIIGFVETQIGAANVGGGAGADAVREALPRAGGDLSPTNSTDVELRTLSFASSANATSFAVSVDVVGAKATDPAIALPADVAGWLSIRSIAVDFAITASQ